MISTKSNLIFSDPAFLRSFNSRRRARGQKSNYWMKNLYNTGGRIKKILYKQDTINSATPSLKQINNPNLNSDQNLIQSGINEHTKNIATKKEDDMQKIDDLVKMSNRRIISISSQFPWDLFPNTIEVEESKVIFKFRQFLSSQSHSLDIKDISNVFIESSLFFSTLQVVSRTYVQNDIKIGKLNKTMAVKVQNIIEGLRTFMDNNINTSNYEINELVAKIDELHANHAN